jgi:hypothetical protein
MVASPVQLVWMKSQALFGSGTELAKGDLELDYGIGMRKIFRCSVRRSKA